jgi:hypothetical protein
MSGHGPWVILTVDGSATFTLAFGSVMNALAATSIFAATTAAVSQETLSADKSPMISGIAADRTNNSSLTLGFVIHAALVHQLDSFMACSHFKGRWAIGHLVPGVMFLNLAEVRWQQQRLAERHADDFDSPIGGLMSAVSLAISSRSNLAFSS